MNKEKWEGWKKKYWPPRKDQLLILALLGLLLAVIAVPVQKDSGEETVDTAGTYAESEDTGEDYESRMERRLEEMLSHVEGVGEVRVMLTFADNGQKQVEKDVDISENSTQEETVYEEQGSSVRVPYVSSETTLQVEGVLIVAEGGGDVKADIIDAVQALFGIEAHKIKIMKYGGD